jgi:hypothetical protein
MTSSTRPSELAELIRDPDTVRAVEELHGSAARRRPQHVPLPINQCTDELIEAEATMRHGWQPSNRTDRMPMSLPLPWDAACQGDRRCGFELHSWDPMSAPLVAYSTTGVREYLEWCVQLALDWALQHPNLDPVAEFSWYGMAVGKRAFRLGYMLSAGSYAGLRTDDLITLAASLRLHLRNLGDEAAYQSHSNQGVYQVAGQLAASRAIRLLPESSPGYEQGQHRLRNLILNQFDCEGAHHEHSPSYHLIVLRTLVALRTLGLVEAPEAIRRLEAAEAALAWFVAPVGIVPTVGDSDRLPSAIAEDPNFRAPELRYALSAGAEGEAAQNTFRSFQEAGYVSARDCWAAADDFRLSSYLLQSCGFHSRVHKHADDLSFVWYARGLDLLTDPGRFGYPGRMDPDSPLGRLGFYYDDPARIYVESTRSHNCLEIDYTSYPRRGVAFYGSAIRTASRDETTGVVASESAVAHFDTIDQMRLLFHLPGEWTVVVDRATDAERRTHDYCQRFQFGPELELLDHDARSVLLRVPTTGERLEATQLRDANPLTPVRGQTEPELQGFVSRTAGELIPAWSAGWELSETPSATLCTLLVLGPAEERSEAAAELEEEGSSGEVRWSGGEATHALRWWRDADGRLAHSYEAAD